MWSGEVRSVTFDNCGMVWLQAMNRRGAVTWQPAVGARIVIEDSRREVLRAFREGITGLGVNPQSVVDAGFAHDVRVASEGQARVEIDMRDGVVWVRLDELESKNERRSLEVGVGAEDEYGTMRELVGVIAVVAWKLPPRDLVELAGYVRIRSD